MNNCAAVPRSGIRSASQPAACLQARRAVTFMQTSRSAAKVDRLETIAEVVAGLVFLASDESSFVTGAELAMDDGATVRSNE